MPLAQQDPNVPGRTSSRSKGRTTKKQTRPSSDNNGKCRAPPSRDELAVIDHIVGSFRGREALLLHLIKRRCHFERNGTLSLSNVVEKFTESAAKSEAIACADAATQTCFDDQQRERAMRRRLEKRITALEFEREALISKNLELSVASESRRKDVVLLQKESQLNLNFHAKLLNILDGLLLDDSPPPSSTTETCQEVKRGMTGSKPIEKPNPTVAKPISKELDHILAANKSDQHSQGETSATSKIANSESMAKLRGEAVRVKSKSFNNYLTNDHQSAPSLLPGTPDTIEGESTGKVLRRKSLPIAVPPRISNCPFDYFNSNRERENREPSRSFIQRGLDLPEKSTGVNANPLSTVGSFMSKKRQNEFEIGTSAHSLTFDMLITPGNFQGFMTSSRMKMNLDSSDPSRVSQNGVDAVEKAPVTPARRRQPRQDAGGDVTPLGRERLAFRAAMASAERRSIRLALEASEEKLRDTTSKLEGMKSRAEGLDRKVLQLNAIISDNGKTVACARSILHERMAQANTALQSVRSLNTLEIQRTTTRRGRSTYYKRLGL